MSIVINNLHKEFKVHQKAAGLRGSIISLFNRKWITKHALKNININIAQGEIVGLLGANGAGKTTLAKVLAGIIHPTSGEAKVLGHTPWLRSNEYRKQMTLLMGQKASLWWDLPASDGYLLLKDIYQIPPKQFTERIALMAELLDVKDQLNIQIRRLSLGERMKVELIAALLHNPKVIFLDEPTIGLDLTSQNAIRQFIKNYHQEFNPTIILTSHYMQDIEDLCERLIILKEGEKIFDGDISTIRNFVSNEKQIELTLAPNSNEKLLTDLLHAEKIELISEHPTTRHYQFNLPRHTLSIILGKILTTLEIADLQIHDIEIGTIIERIQREGIHA